MARIRCVIWIALALTVVAACRRDESSESAAAEATKTENAIVVALGALADAAKGRVALEHAVGRWDVEF